MEPIGNIAATVGMATGPIAGREMGMMVRGKTGRRNETKETGVTLVDLVRPGGGMGAARVEAIAEMLTEGRHEEEIQNGDLLG